MGETVLYVQYEYVVWGTSGFIFCLLSLSLLDLMMFYSVFFFFLTAKA